MHGTESEFPSDSGPAAGELLAVAEDDDGEYYLLSEALHRCSFSGRVFRVRDGQELLDRLLGTRGDGAGGLGPFPRLILLDLNMPRLAGLETLKLIKSHPLLRRIPVLIFTTTGVPSDADKAYDLGANAFINKPMELRKFLVVVGSIVRFWFRTAAPATSETPAAAR